MLLNFLCWRPSLQSARRIASKRILVLTEFLLNFVLTGLYTLMSRSCLLGYLVYHYRERSWVSLSYVFSYMIKFRVMFLAAVRVTAWSLFIVYCVSVIFTRSEIHRMIAWVNSCVLTGYPHWHRFFWPCLGRFEQTAQRVADVLGYKAVNMFSRDVNKNCLIKGCCWSTIAHTGSSQTSKAVTTLERQLVIGMAQGFHANHFPQQAWGWKWRTTKKEESS